MISMKNDKIIASWSKIEPSDSANNRMLSAIIEQNHSAHKGKDMVNNMRNAIRSKKVLAAIAACLVAVVIGVSLGWFGTTNNHAIYKSENVEVTLLKDNDEIRVANYQWVPVNDDIAFTKNNVIIVGEVNNVRPAIVSYNYMDTDVSDYITIFDVKVSEVLACRSDSVHSGDIVTVGVGYNIGKYGEGLPIIEDGRSYMIFCYTTDTINDDVLELSKYVDCWISSPKDLFVEKIGDYYLSIDYFSDVPESIALSEKLHMTKEQIDSFVDMNKNSEDILQSNSSIPGGINPVSLNKDEMSILRTLSERTIQHSEACWNLYCRACLCPCNVLEEYVRNKALAYN